MQHVKYASTYTYAQAHYDNGEGMLGLIIRLGWESDPFEERYLSTAKKEEK